jgi:hypothetical protein
VGAIDGTSSSTPPTLSTNNTTLQPLTRKHLNTKNKDIRQKKTLKEFFKLSKTKKTKW